MQDSARKGTSEVYTWLKHGAQSLAIVSSLDYLQPVWKKWQFSHFKSLRRSRDALQPSSLLIWG
eukprot:105013-Amphidinium_carterae.1